MKKSLDASWYFKVLVLCLQLMEKRYNIYYKINSYWCKTALVAHNVGDMLKLSVKSASSVWREDHAQVTVSRDGSQSTHLPGPG